MRKAIIFASLALQVGTLFGETVVTARECRANYGVVVIFTAADGIRSGYCDIEGQLVARVVG